MDITYTDLIIFIVCFLIAFYLYGIRKYDHFKGKGVKYLRPSFPFFGSGIDVLLQREHFKDFVLRYYNMFSGQNYIGMFEGTKPMIMLRDLELIKRITIKDFDSFPNHRSTITEDFDPFFGNSLISLQNEKWRDMRATLSPAFTSSKIKNMFTLLNECAKDFADYFSEEAQKENNTVEIETKDVFTRYTNDVVATSAFGLKMNSLRDKNHEFYNMSKIITDLNGFQLIKVVLFGTFPKLCKLIKLQFFPARTVSFFRNIVESTMVNRQKTGIVRHDMIDILVEAKKGSLKHDENAEDPAENEFAAVEESSIGKRLVTRKWSDDELTAQAVLFLMGGFEPTSTLIVFFFYEMVRNPTVQKRVQDEIDVFLTKSGGKINYEDIKQLKYLDMTITETLRMWPPTMAVDRICSKEYILPPATEESVQKYTIKSGESVLIPIYAIHHDPEYYREPEVFYPERFSNENKLFADKTSFMPFGVGPRNCIGSRYALIVCKIIVFHILSKFDIVPTERTEIPVKLAKTFGLKAENGIRVGLKLRNYENK